MNSVIKETKILEQKEGNGRGECERKKGKVKNRNSWKEKCLYEIIIIKM